MWWSSPTADKTRHGLIRYLLISLFLYFSLYIIVVRIALFTSEIILLIANCRGLVLLTGTQCDLTFGNLGWRVEVIWHAFHNLLSLLL